MSQFTEMVLRLGKALESGGPMEWYAHENSYRVRELLECALQFSQTPPEFKFEFKPVVEPVYEKVILVSGGMDSCIMWYKETRPTSLQINPLAGTLPLFVDLGQSYVEKELAAIRQFGIDPVIVRAPWKFKGDWKHIVPGRNLLLIALASEWLRAGDSEIWLGAVEGETDPTTGDKSPLFFSLVSDLINTWTGKRITIRTLQNKTKNDWLKWYLEQPDSDADSILNTVTCFADTPKPCGQCQACVRKWIALRYCNIDTKVFFEIDPPDNYQGNAIIDHYRTVLNKALREKNFTHYSERRCQQDLKVIFDYDIGL